MKITLMGLLIVLFLIVLGSTTLAYPALEAGANLVADKIVDLIKIEFNFTYTLQRGDTLHRISRRFNTTVDKLMQLNPQIKNPNLIYVGDVLIIPPYTPDRTTATVSRSAPRSNSQTFTATITGYAPLDPKAVKGVCYSGDPTVTASGSRTTPMRTIAMDKRFPFGTKVKIHHPMFEDIVFIVEDRFGGGDHGNKLDICFLTKGEALEWGRRKVEVTVYFDGL